jgi:hypothetical protein
MNEQKPKELPKGIAAEEISRPPGTCFPWEKKAQELPPIQGDAELVRRIWEETDALAYLYIWQCLLSF